MIRLLLLDPALWEKMDGLTGEEFSSPLLGRTFGQLYRRAREGRSVQLAVLAGECTAEEMDHLAQVAAQPESLARSGQAIQDYISVIRGEALKRREQGDALLLAAQKK